MCISADIDECKEGPAECHSNATCMNIMGSYTCACDYGYTGDGFDCAGKTCYVFISACMCIVGSGITYPLFYRLQFV